MHTVCKEEDINNSSTRSSFSHPPVAPGSRLQARIYRPSSSGSSEVTTGTRVCKYDMWLCHQRLWSCLYLNTDPYIERYFLYAIRHTVMNTLYRRSQKSGQNSCATIWRSRIQILARIPAIPTKDLFGFPQSSQANSGRAPSVKARPLPYIPFPTCHSLKISCHLTRITRAAERVVK
jgi:hypothetical protein